MSVNKIEYEVGEVVGCYEIVEPRGFAGVLPVAVIQLGNVNAGIRVILTKPKEATS
jgi:hypothetical protein